MIAPASSIIEPGSTEPCLSPQDLSLVRRFYGDAIAPKLRDIQQFAEDEIIVPSGPMAGRPYRTKTKPASRLWFSELMRTGKWFRHIYTGPTQSGKTLDAFVIPICYCLFERREDVIVGVPDLNMSNAKWQKDILPVIEKTQYARFLPKSGQGSKGGEIREIRFSNGTWLTFMSFGGSDKSKAGETAPNIIITETDGANAVSETSEEGTAIDQICARADAFDDQAMIIAECTVSSDRGITWTEYENGSRSEIVVSCPRCRQWMVPERLHFTGWEAATSEAEARERGRFHCTKCATPFTDKERFAANQQSKLLHRGQTINLNGDIEGPEPDTFTLGFRMTAFHNPFRTSESLALRCYKAARALNQDAATRTLLQSQFAEPVRVSAEEIEQVDLYQAAKRTGPANLATGLGVVPEGYEFVTVGVDLRNTQLHYTVIAWRADGTCRVIQYDILKVHSRKQKHTVERAILAALRYFRDEILAHGFQGQDGQVYYPEQVFIDAGYMGYVVYQFQRECWKMEQWHKVIWPYIGLGQRKQYPGRYTEKTKVSGKTVIVGPNFHCDFEEEHQAMVFKINADFYKSFVHNRLRTDIVDEDDELIPGAMTLFVKGDADHTKYTKQLCAENEKVEFDDSKGEYTVWITVSRVNHWFDATYAACCAAVFAGARTTDIEELQEPGEDSSQDIPADYELEDSNFDSPYG